MIFSRNKKAVIFIKLTDPWEKPSNLEPSCLEWKRPRYANIAEVCTAKGWKGLCYLVEVGAI